LKAKNPQTVNALVGQFATTPPRPGIESIAPLLRRLVRVQESFSGGMEPASEVLIIMVNLNKMVTILVRRCLLFVIAAVVFTANSEHLRAGVPRGVFYLNPSDGKAANDDVLANPDVAGISIRYGWLGLEPTEGVFDWTFLDSEVARAAAAGKTVLLRIVSQAGKPQWVTNAVVNAGGSFFTFNDGGTNTSIPVFWDPTFVAKKKAMIAALGAHFGNNPTVSIVSASFANATSEDWNVPHTSDLVTQWLALGWTSEKMLDVGKQIVDATMTAFPNACVTMAVGGNGHVAGPNNLDPDATYLARNTILTARTSWPGRFVAQVNTVSAFALPAPGPEDSVWNLLWNSQPDIGGQMLYWCINDPTYRVNGGIPGNPATILHNSIDLAASYGMKYLEIYQLDVVNLPAEITYARNLFVNSPIPTPTPSATPPSAPTGLKVVP